MPSANTQSHVVELDALRGIAIFGVVMTHVVNSLGMMGNNLPLINLDITQFLNTGGLGVQLFFLLSGFLLTTTETRRYASGTGNLGDYVRRRFLRLAPAYYLALCLALVFALWNNIYHPAMNIGVDLALYLTFLHGLAFGNHSDLDPAYWSLTCEVVFYAALPFVLRLARPLSVRLLWYAATLGLAAGVYFWWATMSSVELRFYLIFHPFAHLHLFLAGSLLAGLAERRTRGRGLSLPAASGDFLLLVALAGITLNAYVNNPAPLAQVVSRLGTETLVAVGFAAYVLGSPLLKAILALPGLAALGRISYSIYLFHGLLMGLAEKAGSVRLLHQWAAEGVPHLALFTLYMAATLLVVVPVCTLSYYWVELPGMRAFRRLSPRASLSPAA
ncbi:MAG TPA: acyltransferase [Chloroflexota bacterium]|nr:acyltransferase [Chloroflexota bacterium]